jgi:hypothetical protein
MSQSNSTNFILETSGYQVVIPNSVFQSTGNLTVNYVVNGSPATLTITIEGLYSPATALANDYGPQPGTPIVLDTYSSTSNAVNRSVSVSQLFDAYRVSASWSGGKNVSVNAGLQTSGPGPSWNSESLPAMQTYTGH